MSKDKRDQSFTSADVAGDPEDGRAESVDQPFLVRAVLTGTYPDPGSTRARWRNVGDVFEVKCRKDYSHRWMTPIKPGEVVEAPVARPVPQTTGVSRKLDPFKLMQG